MIIEATPWEFLFSRRGLMLLFAVCVAGVDLETKQWAIDNLAGQSPVELTSFLRFIYAENTGAAFGLFADGGDAARYGLLAITGVVSIVLLCMLAYSHSWAEAVAFALMSGGALGNFVDRLRLGYVVDFIDVHWGEYHWPTFNIADMAINAGVFLLVMLLLFKRAQPAPPRR